MTDRRLGSRAETVFASLLAGRSDGLHPDDVAEATAFWDWLGEFERPSTKSRVPARLYHKAIAATFLAMVAGSMAWFSSSHWLAKVMPDRATAQSISTGIAERRVVRLADGSTLTLAPVTKVEVRYTPSARHIRLEAGEALFDVAHNPQRPFLVQTRYGEVKAVGTAFDVSLSGREAKVVVVEGVIRIALRTDAGGADGTEPIVKLARKGESVAFGSGIGDGDTTTSFIRQSGSVDAPTATAWTRGKLIFRGEPLRDVILKINLYSRDRLVLADPRDGATLVYGVVDQGDVTAIRDLIQKPDAVGVEKAR
jgi:transmembrane sensor